VSNKIDSPGFLIDLDGLLINSELLSKIAFEKMCAQLGCIFSDSYHASIHGKRKSQWSQELIDSFSLPQKAEEIADLHSQLLFSEMDRAVRLMPGAKDLLQWISSSGYPRALVTSSERSYAAKYLTSLGINGFFDEIVSAEDVLNGKPNPEPYLLGARRIFRDPATCIVLEDSVNGVLSGKAAGAIVIAVPSTGSDQKEIKQADYVVSSLVEALNIIKEMGL
jgi:HAD superfamily hydrolase (TIGR01509 family)